jgi:signal peptidase I
MQVLGSVLEFLKTVAIIIIIAFFVRFYLVQPFVVEGSSMEPNFHNAEYLLVNKLSYRMAKPQRGDVIVFHPPNFPSSNYIKRVIAIPGDKIEITNGEIKVNGSKLDEPYIPSEKTLVRNSEAANLSDTMGDDEYFVLGDNREHSSDSREWGHVPMANIIGRAWLVVFPPKNFGFVAHQAYLNLIESAHGAGQ